MLTWIMPVPLDTQLDVFGSVSYNVQVVSKSVSSCASPASTRQLRSDEIRRALISMFLFDFSTPSPFSS